MKILIVDDSLIVRKNLQSIVEGQGYRVIAEAKTGNEAVALYTKYQPDIVTMDITMPDMDGIAAVRLIMGENPNAKIIMMTAQGQENMVIKAIKAGAKGYVLKPLTKKKVVEAIEKILGTQKKDEIDEE